MGLEKSKEIMQYDKPYYGSSSTTNCHVMTISPKKMSQKEIDELESKVKEVDYKKTDKMLHRLDPS